MLQLVNLSNYCSDVELIHNNADVLQAFLNYHHLDGVEMMFCAPWDRKIHKKEWIHGVHLRFWPSWLDFWRGNQSELLKQFGSEAGIKACYGGLTREEWLGTYRENIRTAQAAGAKYMVFHVCHARMSELFDWKFSATDQEVIEGVIDVIDELSEEISADTELLFENLWWPGLTLLDKDLTARLLDGTKHRNVGLMLDTGHLMNTNPELKTEAEGIAYILDTIKNLGPYRRYIKGIHLQRSLSGEYVKSAKNIIAEQASMTDIMNHVMKIDEHLPFSTPEVRQLVDYVKPKYLIHEFINQSMDDWSKKIIAQQQALRYREEV
ncbi:hypothetical protein SPFL3102_01832 [Sporomusaceae bacterium FL31]|nr:hypothetical protein SPFL3101_03466 [Sporomusaceae bacterium FL31]GCE34023.1 hypothetical protein SPFL3102_01832 [Sporomusaceae bacterium]